MILPPYNSMEIDMARHALCRYVECRFAECGSAIHAPITLSIILHILSLYVTENTLGRFDRDELFVITN